MTAQLTNSSNQVIMNQDARQLDSSTNNDNTTTGIQRPNVERIRQNRNHRSFTASEENQNQFLNDHDVRERLLLIRDNLNIRDLSQKYSNNKRPKKTSRYSFTPKKVILLRKRGINKIPAEGRVE